MEALKIIGIVALGVIWLALVILASIAPNDEQLSDYRKFKDSEVKTPQI